MSFLFWLKKKPVEIVGFLPFNESAAKDLYPIAPATEYIPTWWKNLEKSHFNWDEMGPNTSVKNCPGIINSFRKSLIMPLWTDFAFKINEDSWRFQFADLRTNLECHPDYQTGNSFYTDYLKFKIESPWLIKSPVACHYSYPFYNSTEPPFYISPSGVNVPLRGLLSTNVFLFIKREKEERHHFIKAGTPIFQITPLTESPVKLKIEILSKEDYIKTRNLLSAGTHFFNRGLRHLSNDSNAVDKSVRITKA